MYTDNLMVNDAYVKRFVLYSVRIGIITIGKKEIISLIFEALNNIKPISDKIF